MKFRVLTTIMCTGLVLLVTGCAGSSAIPSAADSSGITAAMAPDSPSPVVTTQPSPWPTPTHSSRPTPRKVTHKPTSRTTTHRAAAPKPVPHTTTHKPAQMAGVHPGAFCSPAGAYGHTAKGTLMQCKGPGQPRWRAA
jgi:hypothetical protein